MTPRPPVLSYNIPPDPRGGAAGAAPSGADGKALSAGPGPQTALRATRDVDEASGFAQGHRRRSAGAGERAGNVQIPAGEAAERAVRSHFNPGGASVGEGTESLQSAPDNQADGGKA